MKVLILEDDGGSRDILERNLLDRGHEVETYAEPAKALHALDNSSAQVVLTDIHLPGARGTDHIRDFCSHPSAPLVVVMTGFPALESCLDSFHFGALGYLVKPFRVTEFIEVAEQGLENRALLDEATSLKARVAELEHKLAGRNPESTSNA